MLFSFWYFAYLLLVTAAAVLITVGLKGKSVMAKEKMLNRISSLLLLSYLADFLATSLMTGQIHLASMPFQVCTLSAVLIFLTRFVKPLVRFREPVMLVGLVAALLYLVFSDAALREGVPAGYVTAQSMVLHGLLTVYGVVAIATGSIKVFVKNVYQVAALMSGVVVWSAVGYKLHAVGNHYARGAFLAQEDSWMMAIGAILVFTAVAAAICVTPIILAKLKREKKEEMDTIYIADRRAV